MNCLGAIIVKYIKFFYILLVQQYIQIIVHNFLNKLGKERRNALTLYFGLYNYLYWCSSFDVDLNFPVCTNFSLKSFLEYSYMMLTKFGYRLFVHSLKELPYEASTVAPQWTQR